MDHPSALVVCRDQNYLLKMGALPAQFSLPIFGHSECISVALRDGASSKDVIAAILQAEILRYVRAGTPIVQVRAV